MRVALITIYQVPNYGSVLQAFATQSVLENHNVKCDIIRYKYPNEWHFSKGAEKKSLLKSHIKRTVSFILKTFGYLGYLNLPSELNNFVKDRFNFTKLFNNYDELADYDWTKYDAIVVGSDQVWNPRFLYGDKAFMLGFAPDSICMISIASSFACKRLPENLRNKFRQYISRIDAISVRENNGVNILKEDLHIERCRLILDPTLLLSRDEWLRAIKPTRKHNHKNYILLYGLYYSFEPRPYIWDVVKHFSDKLGYPIIALSGYQDRIQGYDIEIHDYSGASIPEFIELFDNAGLVITSSFHGTAFAINFGKPLISIVPDNGDDRQESILRLIGAENSIVRIGTPTSDINPYYPVDKSQSNLKNLRKENTDWIISSIRKGSNGKGQGQNDFIE